SDSANRQHYIPDIQKSEPDVGIQPSALQHFDEVDQTERHVEREAAAPVEQLAKVRVAGQRALTARALEHPVVLKERFLLEVNVRLQIPRSEEHTSELQSRGRLVCRLQL